MIIPTEDQVYERWDELSDSLKDALTSTANSDLIWKISEAEHIPDAKIYEIGRAVSHVLLGFMHPEDVATELKEGSKLPPQSVATIVNTINLKIFAPLQQDIAKVYAPLSKVAVGPKTMQEVKRPQSGSTPAPAPIPTRPGAPIVSSTAPVPVGPTIISEAFSATPNSRNVAVPAPKPQPPSSNQGWSKASPQQPVVKLGAITPGTPPMPTAPKAPTASQPQTQPQPTPAQSAQPAKPKSISEFERLDAMKKASAPGAPAAPTPALRPVQATPPPTISPVRTPGAAPTPAPAPTPPPMILHEFSKTVAQSPEFQLKTGTGNQMANKPSSGISLPSKPAVLELGSLATPGATPVPRPAPSPTPPPAVNSGPRQITEITPPKPPDAPKDKVIVKDFL